MNVFQKILASHEVSCEGDELAVFPDQVLTQDATGTVVFLQVEAMGIKKAKPDVVSYIDHNTLQVDFRNHDDHRYLQSMAAKLGIKLSRTGNGICHQVHLENFVKPGGILLGSDSHTPTAGGAGMLGMGAGGLDVAVAIAGEPYYIAKPQVLGVELTGCLKPWVTAKDIILYLLKKLTVKGGVGKVIEYFGEGVKTLSVYERATICNMGAEMGATSSLFPSDENTFAYLKSLRREQDWAELKADADAAYDERITIDLTTLEPLIAFPHSPDHVKTVTEAEGTPLGQIAIGSCTNSSYKDMAIVAAILKDKTIAENISLVITPGSRRILSMMSQTGVLQDLVEAGARILEVTCGPCNGIGQAPASGTNSLRTYNRNYRGRSGTADAQVFLASPETAAVSALYGRITDPRKFGECPKVDLPERFAESSNMILSPRGGAGEGEIWKGPNIKPVPLGSPLPPHMDFSAALKVKDHVSTDDILPGGAKMLALRSNIPDSVPYVFSRLDAQFKDKIDRLPEVWALIAGENFGQGSSREHAVMVPMSIGMKLVIAKSFARIYRQNLINYGVVPLTFADFDDYEKISPHDEFHIGEFPQQIQSNRVRIYDKTQDFFFDTRCDFSRRQIELLLQGGLMNYVKHKI
ncbi:aconitate hydratase [Candidatus Formimonas warabiya]|uniref:Aconitate hydratase n=2 Tax=Formimonas warabiya TaxID=1761012 RepID=A0A3G1L0T7_FORW1|nr:aconitate hydratase [Candidatus Formimonas warabiya]